MSRRILHAALLSTLAGLVACSDASAPPETRVAESGVPPELAHLVTTTCRVSEIFTLAAQLSPARRDPDIDLRATITVMLVMTERQQAIGQRLMLELAELLARPRILEKLRDPNGTAPPTKQLAVSELVNLLFECVGFTPPGDVSGAYGPGGGVTVVPETGGTAVSEDEAIGVQISDAATSISRVIYLAPVFPEASEVGECLPGSGLKQVVDCYQLKSVPSVPFDAPVRLVMCSFAGHGPNFDENRHNRLRIAKTEGASHNRWRVYDRLEDVIGLECDSKRPHTAYRSGVLGSLVRFADFVTTPFRPTLLYAADGVGADITDFSLATVVDPQHYATGFEDGDPEFEFTPTIGNFWHRSTLKNGETPFVNSLAVGEGSLVDLAAGDPSQGRLPSPLTGNYSLWYGEDATGNFRGAPDPESPNTNGGLGATANSGTASSGWISIPMMDNAVTLSFKSWFEIESVDPGVTTNGNEQQGPFDVMDVTLEIQGTESNVELDRLNPGTTPPGGSARIPHTSGGTNVPPAVIMRSIDLSEFRGQTVRLHFTFTTGDNQYNGFRGWIVDDVKVVTECEPLPDSAACRPRPQQSIGRASLQLQMQRQKLPPPGGTVPRPIQR